MLTDPVDPKDQHSPGRRPQELDWAMTDAPRTQRRNSISGAISDLGVPATRDIAEQINALLADTFALYLKTKNFHWHVSGPHFRDYHALLDEHARQIFATTDALAERVRKIGAKTLRSIGDIARRQRLVDNDADSLATQEMLAELCEDNQQLASCMREAHAVCEEHGDVASTRVLETCIDEAEWRIWQLSEMCRFRSL
jgi:starvation-inducible DNA-binding protein